MADLQVVKATQAIVEAYNGGKPYFSMKGVAVVDGDGKIWGIAGVYRSRTQLYLFIDMDDDLKKHPRVILKAAKEVLKICDTYSLVTAYACPKTPTAVGFAAHFGFEVVGYDPEHGKVLARWNR